MEGVVIEEVVPFSLSVHCRLLILPTHTLLLDCGTSTAVETSAQQLADVRASFERIVNDVSRPLCGVIISSPSRSCTGLLPLLADVIVASDKLGKFHVWGVLPAIKLGVLNALQTVDMLSKHWIGAPPPAWPLSPEGALDKLQAISPDTPTTIQSLAWAQEAELGPITVTPYPAGGHVGNTAWQLRPAGKAAVLYTPTPGTTAKYTNHATSTFEHLFGGQPDSIFEHPSGGRLPGAEAVLTGAQTVHQASRLFVGAPARQAAAGDFEKLFTLVAARWPSTPTILACDLATTGLCVVIAALQRPRNSPEGQIHVHLVGANAGKMFTRLYQLIGWWPEGQNGPDPKDVIHTHKADAEGFRAALTHKRNLQNVAGVLIVADDADLVYGPAHDLITLLQQESRKYSVVLSGATPAPETPLDNVMNGIRPVLPVYTKVNLTERAEIDEFNRRAAAARAAAAAPSSDTSTSTTISTRPKNTDKPNNPPVAANAVAEALNKFYSSPQDTQTEARVADLASKLAQVRAAGLTDNAASLAPAGVVPAPAAAPAPAPAFVRAPAALLLPPRPPPAETTLWGVSVSSQPSVVESWSEAQAVDLTVAPIETTQTSASLEVQPMKMIVESHLALDVAPLCLAGLECRMPVTTLETVRAKCSDRLVLLDECAGSWELPNEHWVTAYGLRDGTAVFTGSYSAADNSITVDNEHAGATIYSSMAGKRVDPGLSANDEREQFARQGIEANIVEGKLLLGAFSDIQLSRRGAELCLSGALSVDFMKARNAVDKVYKKLQ